MLFQRLGVRLIKKKDTDHKRVSILCLFIR